MPPPNVSLPPSTLELEIPNRLSESLVLTADVVQSPLRTQVSHLLNVSYCYVFLFHIFLPLLKHSHNSTCRIRQVSSQSWHGPCQSANRSSRQTQILWWVNFPPNGPRGHRAFKTACASGRLETLLRACALSGPVKSVDMWWSVPSAL